MLDQYINLEHELETIDQLIAACNEPRQKAKLQHEREAILSSLYADLDPWQIVALARHPLRPHGNDVIAHISDSYELLHGDRASGDCPATVCALASIGTERVMIVAHTKGRSMQERVAHQFGMPEPKGYRKAKRAFLLAQKLKIPVLTLIDTPGAYPGIEAEEHNQSGAIAENLLTLSQLRVPIINIVLGEGMSGGALGIGIGDCTALMERAIFSVISPEGCASILWKDAKMAPQAAHKMQITAGPLLQHGLIDAIIPEGRYGAFHQSIPEGMNNIKAFVLENVQELSQIPIERLLQNRHQRLCQHGVT